MLCGLLSSCRAGALGLTGFGRCASWALEHWLSGCGTWTYLLDGMWDPFSPGIKPVSPAGRCFTTEGKSKCLVVRSCLTLCDPMDCSPPGSFVHGIFQARILEWVAIPFSRGSSHPRNQTPGSLLYCRRILYHLSHRGSPKPNIFIHNILPGALLPPAPLTIILEITFASLVVRSPIS